MTSLPSLHTTSDVAEALKLHPQTLRRWIKSGRIKVITLPGGQVRFPQSEVDRLMGLDTSDGEA